MFNSANTILTLLTSKQICLFQLSTFPKILDDLLNLEFLDLYANKLITCPSWNSNSRIESLDFEQNVFSTENAIDKDNVSVNILYSTCIA